MGKIRKIRDAVKKKIDYERESWRLAGEELDRQDREKAERERRAGDKR